MTPGQPLPRLRFSAPGETVSTNPPRDLLSRPKTTAYPPMLRPFVVPACDRTATRPGLERHSTTGRELMRRPASPRRTARARMHRRRLRRRDGRRPDDLPNVRIASGTRVRVNAVLAALLPRFDVPIVRGEVMVDSLRHQCTRSVVTALRARRIALPA